MLQACQGSARECLGMSHQEMREAESAGHVACASCPPWGPLGLVFRLHQKSHFSKASRLLRISAAAIDDEQAENQWRQVRLRLPAGVQIFQPSGPSSSTKRILDELMQHSSASRGNPAQLLSVCAPSGDFVEGCKSLPHFHFGEDAYSPAEPLPRSDPRQFRREAAGDRNANERWKAIEARHLARFSKTPSPQPIVFCVQASRVPFPGKRPKNFLCWAFVTACCVANDQDLLPSAFRFRSHGHRQGQKG